MNSLPTDPESWIGESGTATPTSTRAPLTPSTATAHQRAAGIAMMLGSTLSNQVGAATGALAFPIIGPLGVVAVRQLIAAAALGALARPRFRTLTRAQWWPVIGLAITLGVMNLSLYTAVARLGLGLAVTLEFLGPLAVAILSSRRPIDIACAILAGIGVIVLTNPQPSSDFLGILLGLIAALGWAAYILLNRALGLRLPGLQGTAAAGILSAGLWGPIAVIVLVANPRVSVHAIGLAVLCGILASAVPYICDLLTLRRVPASFFGTFMSVNPVWAALAGFVLLGQVLTVHEWVGMGLIVVSNVVVVSAQARARRNSAHRG